MDEQYGRDVDENKFHVVIYVICVVRSLLDREMDEGPRIRRQKHEENV